jgi:hypothetical protein
MPETIFSSSASADSKVWLLGVFAGWDTRLPPAAENE